MKTPLVSIIVPNYNHEAFLEKRLESIFNQTYRNFEVILLDDYSLDGSVSILRKYAEREEVSHVVLNDENSGSPFKQWQKGIALAKGTYIWIAESDDVCKLEFLQKLLDFNAAQEQELGVLYAQSYDIDAADKINADRIYYTENFNPNLWKNDFKISGTSFVSKYLKVKCVIPNASAVIFKRALVPHSFFSETHLTMKMCGDWLFWLKICPNTHVGFVSEPLNYFREHGAVTRNHSNYQKIFQRCFEERLVREYLSQEKSIDQEEEIIKLYKRWFRANSFSRIVTRLFYRVRLKQTSLITYLNLFFKHHRTKEKLIGKRIK